MAPARTVVIGARFNGPPGSANGGYACGVAAGELTDGPAQVALHGPPPLEVPLEVVEGDGVVELRHHGALVARAVPWDGEVAVPNPPSRAALDAAVDGFDLPAHAREHGLDVCFACGPARREDDGLRLFPGAIEGAAMVAWPWTPSPSMGGGDGLVDPRIVWAALDCPGWAAWVRVPGQPATGPAVLGRLGARIDRRPAVGEPLVVGGWPAGGEGRKRFAGSAVWTRDGALLAAAAATWVELRPDQVEAFGIKV